MKKYGRCIGFFGLLFFAGVAVSRAGVQFQSQDIKINTTTDGTSYNGGAFTCDQNGRVYAFYNSSRNAIPPTLEANALEVYFNISTDHGATWLASDVRVDDGPGPLGTPGYLHLWTPFLGCNDTGRFYCGWQDGRDFNNESRPNHGTGWWEDGFCTRTLDTGSTWTANTRINSWNGNYPRCAQPMSANDQSGNVYVAWYSTIEQPTNYNVIRFNRSTDFGAAWENETRLDHAAASADEEGPTVKCDESGHVYASWQSRGRGQVRFNTSTDYGETWQSDDIRVDTDSVSGLQKGSPSLTADQTGHVYAAWSDWRNVPEATIYFNRSTDHGITWGANDIRIDSRGISPSQGPEYGPQIACTTDGMVYAVWEDKRNGGQWDVFFNRSTDFGATWGTDTRLDTDLPGIATSFRPSLACDARGWVYVAWEDGRQGGGSPHIYMNYSTDRGTTWLDADFQVDTGTPVYQAVWPRLLADPSGTIYLGWGYHQNTWPEEVYDFHFNHAFATSPTPASSPAPSPTCGPSVPPDRAVLASGDYNGDSTADIAIFRPSAGLWSIRNITRAYFGASSDFPVPGDYDGDGSAEAAIFRPSAGLWSVMNLTRVYYGASSDLPVPGDFNGDGICDIGVFREGSGQWNIRDVTRIYFGALADWPMPGDYAGDGTSRAGIYRAAAGVWAIESLTRFYFGGASDWPVSGDWTGDGTWRAGIFRARAGMWAVRDLTRIYFGVCLDYPRPADYNGNGADEFGIFRPETGLWSARGVTAVYFGSSADIPVTR